MADIGRPCKLRLQIEDGLIQEMEDMGFHLMESPDVIVPVQREYETEDYPEYDGVKIYPYTSHKSFDYTCKMLYVGDLAGLNAAIRALWESMFEQLVEGGIRKAKEITVFNDYKSVAIVGYAKDMPGEETFVELRKGCWKFDFTLFVANPAKCNWSAPQPEPTKTPITQLPSGFSLNGRKLVFERTDLPMPTASPYFPDWYYQAEAFEPENQYFKVLAAQRDGKFQVWIDFLDSGGSSNETILFDGTSWVQTEVIVPAFDFLDSSDKSNDSSETVWNLDYCYVVY